MDYKRLPIWQQAQQLLLVTETTVRSFSRYHKYSIGAELRQSVLRLCKAIHRVFTRSKNSKVKMVQYIAELIDTITSTKLQEQTMKPLPYVFICFILALTPMILAAQTCKSTITPTTPDSRFTLNGDGTATDNKTGLIWMRCSLGQVFDSENNTCTGNQQTYKPQEALYQAKNSNFTNHNDWRLPNIKELSSIIELACYGPAINLTIFPNTSQVMYADYWTSSPYENFNIGVKVVNFYYGNDLSSNSLYHPFYVRLVRGGAGNNNITSIELLSEGKPAIQSTTLNHFGLRHARFAVDGNTSGIFSTIPSNFNMSITAFQNQPWWQVDLGLQADLSHIKLWNRTDCCADRLSNFYVIVSDSDMLGNTLDQLQALASAATPNVYMQYISSLNGEDMLNVPLNNMDGRYIRVQLTGSEHSLTLAEVQVYGKEQ